MAGPGRPRPGGTWPRSVRRRRAGWRSSWPGPEARTGPAPADRGAASGPPGSGRLRLPAVAAEGPLVALGVGDAELLAAVALARQLAQDGGAGGLDAVVDGRDVVGHHVGAQ